MRFGLDARYLSHGLTGGVRTYVRQLAWHLPRLAPDDRFVYYADAKGPFEVDDLPANVVVRVLPWRSVANSVINDVRIARWMAGDGIDVAHFPANYGPRGRYRLVVTVHDALNLFPMHQHLRGFGRRPRQVAMMAYLGWKTRAALRHASAIITISDHARLDIAARSGCPASRIRTIHEAASDEFREIADETFLDDGRRRFGLTGPVVLADGIKNPEATIAAFAALPDGVRAATTLVFFSREATPRPAVAAALASPGVRFVPQPATPDLVLLMNLASVFVFPSWYEGFGLPVVEAMRCGLPVLASSRGSIPEVLGGAGLVADLEAPAELAGHLARVLASPAVRDELRAASLARAAAFDWRVTAGRTLEVYREVAAARSAAPRP